MKKQSFLSKLRKEGKLELVEPSEEICNSYVEKAEDFLIQMKLLIRNLSTVEINKTRERFILL